MQGRSDRHALSVVEAAYDVAKDLEPWMAGVLHAATPLLERGHGVHGYVYEAHPFGTVTPRSAVVETAGTPPGFAEAARQGAASIPRPLVAPLYVHGPAFSCLGALVPSLGVEMFGDFKPFEIMRGFGIRDMFGVTGYDPSGTGLLMCAPMRASERVEDREVERWRMLRAHLLAGLRLQMSLGLAADGDAVLTPRGRVLHAEGAARTSRAREALRQRAHQIDRARSAAGRRDPMGAIEAWRGLVDGTWSLIDRFDRDGRRYLVAHRNDPQVVAPRPLSPRERQILAYAALGYSNKHIAYVLDLAPSTISSHLRSAMRRMGVRDRASLALLWPGLDERRPRASA